MEQLQQPSGNKDELLYQQVNYGDSGIQSIKSLFHQGAGLEWFDEQGNTALIAACLNAQLYNVAKTLIHLGANVNAYRPGIHAGTPLHHAAKTGLEQTVKLLLSHGANASVMNDDCQTAIDVARTKGYTNVVGTIERHVSPFLGWLRLRKLHGPRFLKALTSPWLPKKIWAVVIPSDPANPLKLQLVLYSTPVDTRPSTIITLWKAKIEQPKFHQSDPTLIILDDHTKTRYKFASLNKGGKYQLQCFYSACIGISQVMRTSLPVDTTAWVTPGTTANAIPSAQPIPEGPGNGPAIDLPVQSIEGKVAATSEVKEDGSVSSMWVICLDAPIEGACIPCGHMAGCMPCSNEIQAKKWDCPVCRAKIQQVIRLYAV